jgi:hypothetical protein
MPARGYESGQAALGVGYPLLVAGMGYPKTPMPNKATHMMENPTRMIIHMSSFFMMHSPS